jgi:hypothetical protein
MVLLHRRGGGRRAAAWHTNTPWRASLKGFGGMPRRPTPGLLFWRLIVFSSRVMAATSSCARSGGDNDVLHLPWMSTRREEGSKRGASERRKYQKEVVQKRSSYQGREENGAWKQSVAVPPSRHSPDMSPRTVMSEEFQTQRWLRLLFGSAYEAGWRRDGGGMEEGLRRDSSSMIIRNE